MPNTVTIGEVMLLAGVDTAGFEKFAAEEFNAFGQEKRTASSKACGATAQAVICTWSEAKL